MTRRTFIGLAGLSMAGGLTILWLAGRPVVFAPADSKEQPMRDMPGMDMPMKTEVPGKNEPETVSGKEAGTVTIAAERLQMIGVKYETVARRPLEKVIRTVGRVAVDERRLAKVTIKFHGWIEKLLVSAVGDHVKKGDVLFTIYSPDLVATQEEYLLALESRRQLGESTFPEVSRGSKDLLDSTRHRFHLWDISDDHIRDLERTGTVLRTLPIHSPLTGTVIKKEVLQGTHVEPGEELYTIADLSHIWVLGDIYEYELTFVRKGQKATVTLSYDPATMLTGVLSFVYPTLDPKTRTAKVRIELDNPDEKFKPDMYANVALRIDLGTKLTIPQEAVIESGEKQIVFLHRGDGRLEPRLITTGMKTGEWYEVLGGLTEGDHVVTSANFLIDSESRLKAVVESMGGMSGMK